MPELMPGDPGQKALAGRAERPDTRGGGPVGWFFHLPNDSVPKMLGVTLVLCLVCSVLVSGAAVLLKPLQERNVENARRERILAVAGLLEPDAPIDEQFEDVQVRLVDLDTGEYTDAFDPDRYDMEVAARDPTVSQVVPAAVDIAGIKRRPRYAPVYLVPGETGIQTIILPVKGYGLWSTMYGFLALEGDGNTVKGLTFYQHGETPGLGGEIENPRWQARFRDKKVYGEEGQVRLRVAKGETQPGAPNAEYVVDGISGATLTMNGVSHMIEYWLGERGFGPYLQRLRQAGGST